MSGPKVVRVVSREELVSQCNLLLARLDQSVVLWKEACESIGQLEQSDLDKVVARRNELESLFRSDRFQEFTRDANSEVAFLEADIGKRRTLFYEAKAREAGRRESGLQTATTLLSVLKASATPVNGGLLNSLELAVSGSLSREEVDKLLAQGFKLLTPVQERTLSPYQQDLARRLASGAGPESLEQWKAPSTNADPRSEAVVRGIAELSLHVQQSQVTEFEERFAALRAILDEGLRNVRLDSLSIELNQARLEAIRSSGLVNELRLLDAEFAAFGGESDELRHKLQEALGNRNPKDMAAMLETARARLSDMQRQMAAAARRQAVLHGLAKLGYSVNEGMSIALSNAGRVVVWKPDLPGYGVELVGGDDSGRLQVRTVALAAARDKTRDLDAETRWCSDFTKLKTDLGTNGNELIIERSTEVGAVPLRVVEIDAIDFVEFAPGNASRPSNQKSSSSSSS